jgi:hypothetical protein
MSDMTEKDGPVSFVRWIHAQAKGDKERTMPYSAIYRWGPNIQAIVGLDGKYSAEWVALELAQQGADAVDLSALASAEAAWRVDSIIETAEDAGVSLNVSETAEGADIALNPAPGTDVEHSEPKVLCGYRNHRGEGCVGEAVPGAGRCARHGGAITDPEVRRSFLLISFAKVIEGSVLAVDALMDVAENGRSEMARVQAAKELLDRAGVQQDQHVHIHRPEEDASEDDLVGELRRRLASASSRLRIEAIPVSSQEITSQGDSPGQAVAIWQGSINPDDDIVDATIVDSPDDDA